MLKTRIIIFFLLCTLFGAYGQTPVLITQNLEDIDNLTSFNGVLYFSARPVSDNNNQLYRSDGTEEGTYVLKEITSNHADWYGSEPDDLIVINNRMFFEQYDSTYSVKKLWITDGTESGTSIVKHFDSDNSWCIYDPIKFDNQLFFVLQTIEYGYELWKSDGTEQGTNMVKDIFVGAGNSHPENLMIMNGELYFFAIDGIHGNELWKTDGTELGTQLVKDIKTGVYGTENWNAMGDKYAVCDNQLFFAADDGIHGIELWKTDGSGNGTMIVKDINPGENGSKPSDFEIINTVMYFSAADTAYPSSDPNATDLEYNTELYRSDGSEAGTYLVKDINSNFISSGVSNLMTCNNQLLFTAEEYGILSRELWKSDGTTSGTSQLIDIFPGENGSFPNNFCSTPTSIYFSAKDNIHGFELWTTQGSELTTEMVYDIGAGNSSPQLLTLVNSTLYFTTHGKTKLWKLGLINNLNSPKSNPNVQIYPVPFQNMIHIKSNNFDNKKVIINVVDQFGCKVFHNTYFGGTTISVEKLNYLNSGLFTIEIISEDHTEYYKVLKTD